MLHVPSAGAEFRKGKRFMEDHTFRERRSWKSNPHLLVSHSTCSLQHLTLTVSEKSNYFNTKTTFVRSLKEMDI